MPGTCHDAEGKTHTILHVEDNLANLKLVERIVDNRPAVTVVGAMQGRLGLELAQQHRPQLILLDLHLPDVAGDEILQQLLDEPVTADIPVVIISAEATPGHIQRLLSAGAVAYLTSRSTSGSCCASWRRRWTRREGRPDADLPVPRDARPRRTCTQVVPDPVAGP